MKFAISVLWDTDNISFLSLSGVQELPQSGLFAFAHVEDVAEAHVCALEVPEASGRYICYEDVLSDEALVSYIYKLYPDSIIPSR